MERRNGMEGKERKGKLDNNWEIYIFLEEMERKE